MAFKAIGTKLKVSNNAIVDLNSIGGLDIKADTMDTTTLDSQGGYREFIQGLKDGGEVSISGYFNPNDTTGQVALYTSLDVGTILPYSMLFPSAVGASWDFNGIVTGIKTEAQKEDLIPFEATIKVTGKPVLNLTASAGLSALAATATGGTLSPTFNNGTYNYVMTGVTGTSLTVTATGAGQTINLYVNGALVQALTSGAASNAYTLSGVGSVYDVLIVANEANKVAKTYSIRVVKTA